MNGLRLVFVHIVPKGLYIYSTALYIYQYFIHADSRIRERYPNKNIWSRIYINRLHLEGATDMGEKVVFVDSWNISHLTFRNMLGDILEFTITEPIILTAEVNACKITNYNMNGPAFFS